MRVPKVVDSIEIWPIDKLIPYAKNARVHSESQIAEIAGSILEYGFNSPILIDTKSGIIAGHGRLAAARKLGMPSVPIIILDHLTDQQKRAYILADNSIALNATWDDSILAEELGDLLSEDYDIDGLGFSAEELAELNVGYVYETSTEEKQESEGKPTRTRSSAGSEEDKEENVEREPVAKAPKEADGSKEFSQSQFSEFKNQCPRCSFEFNGNG